MKPRFQSIAANRSSRRGFTMIEIAIALGVIAFALVAIMGILPLGLTVQRWIENAVSLNLRAFNLRSTRQTIDADAVVIVD